MVEFLDVIDAAEAHRRFREAVQPKPIGIENVEIAQALGRVLARDVVSPIDVPGFDRSNVDGYAVRAADTFGAEESAPRLLTLNEEVIAPGRVPSTELAPGTATRISTGGMIPRGADAVVMIEHTHTGPAIIKPVSPGQNISFAGSDIARGEIVLRAGTLCTARETGTLAALGITHVEVYRKPSIAVFSTGNEIIPPGTPWRPGLVYDSNARILCDSLRELGCDPVDLGVVPDDLTALQGTLARALAHDAAVLSGGTSKGEADLSVVALREVATILVHGVALKPGKPLCLAVSGQKPIAILPGFPTSAIVTFHEFVAPILREMTGLPPDSPQIIRATVPMRINTEKGRAEFVLVSLVNGPNGLAAYPMGKGSGSITTFARADGFLTLGRQQEYVEAGEQVEVRLLGRDLRPADLIVIGSHCVGLDDLLSLLRRQGFTSKALLVGSQGGLTAVERGECDIAGIHLCNERGIYNTPFLKPGMKLIRGYRRMQGVIYRDREPELRTSRMVNRNRGSGTRLLIEEHLSGARPPGYHVEAKSHNAVAAAVAQGRADWGVAIKIVADLYGLRFRPLREEQYDFIIPEQRVDRPAVAAFIHLLSQDSTRQRLAARGFSF